MKDTLFFTMKITLTFMAVVTVLFYLGAGILTGTFMKDAQVVAYGTKFMRGFCLGLVFLCVDFIAVGVFQATGKGKEALIFAIMRKIVLEIPALYLLNRLFPLYGLAYAQFAAEVVLAAAAVWVLIRMFRKLQKTD